VNRIVKIILYSLLSLITAGLLIILFSNNLQALGDMTAQSGAAVAHGDGQPTDLFGDSGVFTTTVNILLYVIGALSVIMIIVGGIRYAVSGGNSTAIGNAKNTVLYAVVGLLVAFLSYAAISFILSSLGNTSNI